MKVCGRTGAQTSDLLIRSNQSVQNKHDDEELNYWFFIIFQGITFCWISTFNNIKLK